MTDQALVELFFARSEEAIPALQAQYGPYCRAVAAQLLSDPRDVDECLNDAFLAVWQAIPPTRPEHFKGWLAAIVRNRALAIGRENSRRPPTVDEAALELSSCLPPGDTPSDTAEYRALSEAVAHFLRAQPKDVRTAFLRRYTYLGRQMTKYPLSDFSPALNAASKARENPAIPVSLNFNTWDEVQAFLGKGIPCVWPEDWDGQFQVVLFHTESEVLWGIDVYSIDLGRQAEIHVEIRTELWQNEYAQAGAGFPEGDVENLPSHTMPSGATALFVQYTGTQEHPGSSCTGYFMQAGILYAVTAISPVPPQNDTVSQLHALLDSFSASR